MFDDFGVDVNAIVAEMDRREANDFDSDAEVTPDDDGDE